MEVWRLMAHPRRMATTTTKPSEEGVFPPQEGHGAVMDLIGEIHHDPGSGVLTLHVPVDQEGDRKAHGTQDPGPFC